MLPDILAARQQFAAALAAAEAEQALRRRQAWVHAGERPGPALSRPFQLPQQEHLIAALHSAGGRLLASGPACAQRVAWLLAERATADKESSTSKHPSTIRQSNA